MKRQIIKHFAPCLIAAIALLLAFTNTSLAQTISLDMGDTPDGSTTGRILQLVALMTVLSLAPSILVTMTSFTRIIVVLSFLRSALGIQQTPPNTVLISLALFMSLFIMMPTLQAAYEQGIQPLVNEEMDEIEAFDKTSGPFKDFMLEQVREKDLTLFAEMANLSEEDVQAGATALPLRVVVPAFMISELRRAFEIGFLLFLPFLIIDMVTASILMSMGMMMLPPVMIAMPFKIIFFVMVDGWYLITGSLIKSFG